MLIIAAVSPGEMLRLGVSDCAIDEKRGTNEMLRVPVYSGVLKLKNVNKKRLCWQAKIARDRFAHSKALSCCCCRYIFARNSFCT